MNDLALKAKNDQNALLLLWQGCSRYAYKVAMRYKNVAALNGAVDMYDLKQCAFLGFYEAVQDFDPLRGDFLTLLSYGVRTACRNALGLCGRQRTEHYTTESLSAPIPGTDDLTLEDTIPDETASTPFEQTEMRRDIEKALQRLPEEMAAIIRLHDLHGLTLAQAAEKCGCPINTASLWRRAGFRKLRASPGIRSYKPVEFRYKSLEAFRRDWTSVVEEEVICRIDG